MNISLKWILHTKKDIKKDKPKWKHSITLKWITHTKKDFKKDFKKDKLVLKPSGVVLAMLY